MRRVLEANCCESVAVRAFDTSAADVEPIIGFVREGNIAQFNDHGFVEELVSWIRFTKRDARERRDGLAAEALGFPSVPRRLGLWIMTTRVKPGGEAARQERAIRSGPLLLLIRLGFGKRLAPSLRRPVEQVLWDDEVRS